MYLYNRILYFIKRPFSVQYNNVDGTKFCFESTENTIIFFCIHEEMLWYTRKKILNVVSKVCRLLIQIKYKWFFNKIYKLQLNHSFCSLMNSIILIIFCVLGKAWASSWEDSDSNGDLYWFCSRTKKNSGGFSIALTQILLFAIIFQVFQHNLTAFSTNLFRPPNPSLNPFFSSHAKRLLLHISHSCCV